MPRPRDMAIFVLTTMTTTTRPITLPLAHARGVIIGTGSKFMPLPTTNGQFCTGRIGYLCTNYVSMFCEHVLLIDDHGY